MGEVIPIDVARRRRQSRTSVRYVIDRGKVAHRVIRPAPLPDGLYGQAACNSGNQGRLTRAGVRVPDCQRCYP